MSEEEYEAKYVEELNRKNEEAMQRNLEKFRKICEKVMRNQSKGWTRKQVLDKLAEIGFYELNKLKEQIRIAEDAKKAINKLSAELEDVKEKLKEALRSKKGSLIKEYGYRKYVLEQQISNHYVNRKAALWYAKWLDKEQDILIEYALKLAPKYAKILEQGGYTVVRDDKGKILKVLPPGTKVAEVKL